MGHGVARGLLSLAYIFLVFALIPRPALAVGPYTITDLGFLDVVPVGASQAQGLNDLGQIVGSCGWPVVYSDGVMTDLSSYLTDPPSSLPWGTAYDINNQGHVIGRDGIADDTWLIADGQLTYFEGLAFAINNAGQVVGEFGYDGTYRAWLYDNGVVTDIGTLPGYTGAVAFGINDLGQIVGYAEHAGGSSLPMHAFLYDNGTFTDLGTLGQSSSYATAVNNLGQVVGSSWVGDSWHVFLHDDGVMTDLGGLEGWHYLEPHAINDAGQIVGTANDDYFSLFEALFWEDGVMYLLDDLLPPDSGWDLLYASDINESGQIVGWGINPDGIGRGFLMTPVPEPATLFVVALGALLGATRLQRVRPGRATRHPQRPD
ncbi:MAG: DUF3466 family protein [Phycisphaerae bacterium]|nr:DUF3466 family protein [Phycisphaerae bacterium]